MSLLVLPAGQSLRQIATRLGVPVDELQKHAGLSDVTAPLPTARQIQVPDGFLQVRATRPREPVQPPSGKAGGMNAWLALDIEQKRTRAAGGMHAHDAKDHEQEGLEEARRTYLRFEAMSNELCLELYNNLTATPSVDVRARAFAGQGCAYALRHRLFGDTPERSRPQALSAAKAAQWADPKLSAGHLAMAMALTIEGSDSDREEAIAELAGALRQDASEPWCWAELAALRLKSGDLLAARPAVGKALELMPECIFALETGAALAEKDGDLALAERRLAEAAQAVPTYANVHVALARLRRAQGDSAGAERALQAALALATTDLHRQWISARF